MKFAKSAVTALSVLALSAGAAWATDKPMDGKNADGKLSKKEAANVSRSDESGFARLDKDKDGYISKIEAKGNAHLAKDFDRFDLNNDGKLNRAEYLAASAKEDAVKAKDKVTGSDDKNASTGSTADSKRSSK